MTPSSSVKLRRPIKIAYRNRLTNDHLGEAYKEEFKILLKRKMPRRIGLEVLIHEHLHCMLPDLSEALIQKMGGILSDRIWERRKRLFK